MQRAEFEPSFSIIFPAVRMDVKQIEILYFGFERIARAFSQSKMIYECINNSLIIIIHYEINNISEVWLVILVNRETRNYSF